MLFKKSKKACYDGTDTRKLGVLGAAGSASGSRIAVEIIDLSLGAYAIGRTKKDHLNKLVLF